MKIVHSQINFGDNCALMVLSHCKLMSECSVWKDMYGVSNRGMNGAEGLRVEKGEKEGSRSLAPCTA